MHCEPTETAVRLHGDCVVNRKIFEPLKNFFARWRLQCECAETHCKCTANALRLRGDYKNWKIFMLLHHTLANLTATPLRIEQFSVFRVSAQSQRIAVHSQCICSESQRIRIEVANEQKSF